MASISLLNPKAELAKAQQALSINIAGARGLQEVLRTNLGPKGTIKMLVSGAGDVKLTKDGNVLLHEMQIQHPTASLVARVATAQDDETGDGTTSNVLIIAELLKQADVFLSEGLHPRIISEGFEFAKYKCLEILDQVKIHHNNERQVLINVARTSLRTKLNVELADLITEQVVDAVLAIQKKDEPLDLHHIEIMQMQHKTDMDTELIRGLVLDHGARHPDMKKTAENVFILICNVSLEYEKTEVNSSFFYKSAAERQKFVNAERQFIDERCQKIIELKRKVCDTPDKNFAVINQKGVDPLSLDLLAKEGIIALRRAKRRNMERLALACGGYSVNSVDDMTADCLGFAGHVYEYVLGEEKYTFIGDCKGPQSVTLLVKGPNKHTITQIKDALHDGLHAVVNAIQDKCVIAGAGSFEMHAYHKLLTYMREVPGRAKLGVQAFAESLLIIPKVLAQNAGFDIQESVVKLMDESDRGVMAGIDINTGDVLIPADVGIFDNYVVKKQMINSCSVIASHVLLVDEILRAGLSSLKGDGQ